MSARRVRWDLKMDPDVAERVDRLSIRRGTTRTALVEQALEEMLSGSGGESGPDGRPPAASPRASVGKPAPQSSGKNRNTVRAVTPQGPDSVSEEERRRSALRRRALEAKRGVWPR